MSVEEPRIYELAQSLISSSPDVDDELLQLALRHRVANVLIDALPSDATAKEGRLWQTLITRGRRGAAHSLTLLYAHQQLAQALSARNLDAMWLKGIVLAQSVYDRVHHRPMVDIDFLVRQECHEAVLNTLSDLGYVLAADSSALFTSEDPITPADHHTNLQGGPGGKVRIEVHTDLIYAGYLTATMKEWLWRHTAAQITNDVKFTSLTPEAHLIYLCAHAIMQHTEREFLLLRFLDIHRLICHHSIDWQLVEEGADALHWAYATERALVITKRYFDTPIPQKIFNKLMQLAEQDENADTTRRMQKAGGKWVNINQRLRSASVGQKIVFLRRTLVPPIEYMRHRYKVPASKPIWPYYLRRWSYQSREIIAALRTALGL